MADIIGVIALAVVALVFFGGEFIAGFTQEFFDHRERMAKIKRGVDPDASPASQDQADVQS